MQFNPEDAKPTRSATTARFATGQRPATRRTESVFRAIRHAIARIVMKRQISAENAPPTRIVMTVNFVTDRKPAMKNFITVYRWEIHATKGKSAMNRQILVYLGQQHGVLQDSSPVLVRPIVIIHQIVSVIWIIPIVIFVISNRHLPSRSVIRVISGGPALEAAVRNRNAFRLDSVIPAARKRRLVMI